MSINKYALTSSLLLSSALSLCHAKPIYPAEIAGRDLAYPGLGWLGHVGITNASMMDPRGMNQTAYLIIEVLNEPVVAQINFRSNFKSRSKYWGTKYGVADVGVGGYNVLVEANHQRWWCPKYTTSTAYTIGEGIPTTGEKIKCGVWRCDTYAWWAFYSAGYDTVPGRIMLPRNVFNAFPSVNYEFSPEQSKVKVPLHDTNKTLNDFSAKALNEMNYEDFEMIADIPMELETPQHIAAEMRFANDEQLNDVKRGIFIDRLTIGGQHPNTVINLLDLYKKTNNKEVQSKIIQGLMIYSQQHLDLKQNSNEQQLLKEFFSNLIKQDFSNQTADSIVRGFIDLHAPDEITNEMSAVDKMISKVPHQSSIMLKMSLAGKSKELEKKYISSIISELRKANDSDLDSFLFGPLSLRYKVNGPNYLQPASKKLVVDYLNEVKDKYSKEGIMKNSNDPYSVMTAPTYADLIKYMN